MRTRLVVLIALAAVVMLALSCSSARRILRDRLPPPHEVEGGMLFSYSAPAARMVTLAGQFNNWAGTQGGGRYDPTIDPMSDEDGDGIWTIIKPLPPGRYQYKFVIDNGAVWELDPSNALTGEEGGFTNSLLIVPDNIVYTPSVVTGMVLPGTLDRSAKADFDGWDYGGRFETGLNFFRLGGAVFEPLAAFSYARVEQEGFSESGAGSLDWPGQASK